MLSEKSAQTALNGGAQLALIFVHFFFWTLKVEHFGDHCLNAEALNFCSILNDIRRMVYWELNFYYALIKRLILTERALIAQS